MQINVSHKIVQWINNFLLNRPQWVNTGAPQGCVISPLLFSFYTSDCLCSSPNCHIIKYADDTVITGYLKDDPLCYISEVHVAKFVDWCNRNFVTINVKKTKEMIVDFRRNTGAHEPVY